MLSAAVNAVIVDGIGVGTIVNDDPVLGVSSLVPAHAKVEVHERIALDLTWTHPQAWRNLRFIDVRIVDDRGVVLSVRFHEGRDTLRRLETSGATLDLAESGIVTSSVPSVTLRLQLRFKPSAAGRRYRVEAAATDDAGNGQGFETVGTLEVRRERR